MGLSNEQREKIGKAMGRVPSGLFVLTAQHEDRRAGMLASWVQQCCFEPLMLMIAVAKGRHIMPLMSESRRFGLCQIGEEDRTLMRKFANAAEDRDDPFLGVQLLEHPKDTPILASCMGYLECEVAYHMDVEGDHDIFVGRVLDGEYFRGKPRVHIRTTGLKY